MLTFTSPDEALEGLIKILMKDGVDENTPRGRVIAIPHPISINFTGHRLVSYSSQRDANPFFHIHEAVWMLAGGQNATYLDHFVKAFSSRFAESDGLMHGAYGHRWRLHFSMDQLTAARDLLTNNPQSRQAVVSMWDPDFDLNERSLKDRPCNTHIYFRIYNGRLNMSVCCRSNDLIWGLCGANYVHFGILHQYMAAGLGIPIGARTHFINNLHAYHDTLGVLLVRGRGNFRDYSPPIEEKPLIDASEYVHLRHECKEYVANGEGTFTSELVKLAHQMRQAFNERTEERINYINNPAWRTAARDWIDRRKK